MKNMIKNKTLALILFNISFIFLIFLIVRFGAPFHELFHYVPCKLAGLNPDFHYFNVMCNGIAEKNYFIQFFYFIGPYIAYLIILIALFFAAQKYSYLKYLIPIPVFDAIFNYFASINQSDFIFLMINTKRDVFPFIFSMLLLSGILVITLLAYKKYRIYAFEEFMKSDE